MVNNSMVTLRHTSKNDLEVWVGEELIATVTDDENPHEAIKRVLNGISKKNEKCPKCNDNGSYADWVGPGQFAILQIVNCEACYDRETQKA